MNHKLDIKLTQFSHGAGCGCKIAPSVLNEILHNEGHAAVHPALLVGNDTRDDAAVYAINEHQAIISTTDFFMPIVDDPFDFGGIASVNAISDVYAMGGTPIMAISILGWPLDKIPSSVANDVLKGARDACWRAGIPLAGGHSIDAPEPIFGLAVTGIVNKNNIKKNDSAIAGCSLYLTKPLGIGILTTAQKQNLLLEKDARAATDLMLRLNNIGTDLGYLDGVKAMTDVTGFGLLGHLSELCEGSRLSAIIEYKKVPKISCLPNYLTQKTFPGGTNRNFKSYGHKIGKLSDEQKAVLCDPQTSGGLLIAVEKSAEGKVKEIFSKYKIPFQSFGELKPQGDLLIEVI